MRGYSLVELLAALALLGIVLVATAPITSYLLHQTSVERVLGADFEVGLGLVPALREDVRRAAAAGPALGPLHAGPGGIVLDLGDDPDQRVRAIVYRVEPGVVRRGEYKESGHHLRLIGERAWKGEFSARFLRERPLGGSELVGLEVDAARSGEKVASFRFGLRR